MPSASLIATLLKAPSPDGAELTALDDSVEWLEVRADVVGDIDPDWLRSHFKGRLLYALRTNGDSLNRLQRLKTAARFYDRVELEETDFAEELLNVVPAERRLVSWCGSVNDLSELRARFAHLASVPASVYKMVTNATTIAEEFLPLSLLKSLNRDDTIAFSSGPLGFWTGGAACQSAWDLRTRVGRFGRDDGTTHRQTDR